VDRYEDVPMTSHAEIKNVGFFALDALPVNINEGSLRRIQEALMGFPPDPIW